MSRTGYSPRLAMHLPDRGRPARHQSLSTNASDKLFGRFQPYVYVAPTHPTLPNTPPIRRYSGKGGSPNS